MTPILRMLVLLAAATLATTAEARPCTGYALSASQASGQSYAPAAPVAQLVQLELAAQALPDENCTNVPVDISEENGGIIALVGPGGTLAARIVRSSLTGRVTEREIAVNGQGRGDLARGRRITLDLLEVLPGQFVAAGNYVARLSIASGAGQRTLLPVTVTVQPAVILINGSETGSGNISLGDPTAGARASTTFFMRTNAGVAITARSFNRGRLVHVDGRAVGSFAYAATLAGQALDLSRDAVVTLPSLGVRERGTELAVSVPPTPSLYAGRYEDTLTLEITAF